MTTGQRMKDRRKKIGLSAEKVAELLGVSPATIYRYENGDIDKVPGDKLGPIAKALQTTPAYLMGWNDDNSNTPSNAIPYIRGRRFPIVGDIPARIPVLAEENIEGYEYADVPEGEDYFFLRVNGDSMINAGITSGSLVLIKVQHCADNGQIVACRINGDEATLKRFKQQGDMVILMPENSNYEPIIVSCQDFENGFSSIIGVAVKVVRDLL